MSEFNENKNKVKNEYKNATNLLQNCDSDSLKIAQDRLNKH